MTAALYWKRSGKIQIKYKLTKKVVSARMEMTRKVVNLTRKQVIF